MNDTTTNSENLLLSHKHKWIFNFVAKIEIYLKELLQEIYEFRHALCERCTFAQFENGRGAL